MSVGISYMGTKCKLAAGVSEVIRALPGGPLLDAFSGMCAVAEAVAPSREIWTNDTQLFAAMVGRALFCSRSGPDRAEEIWPALAEPFHRNLAALESRYADHLAVERQYLKTRAPDDVIAGNSDVPYVGNDPSLAGERSRLARNPTTFPYRLATITYAGAFFGIMQCMEIDSLRYAVDVTVARGHLAREMRLWLLTALGRAMSRVNNSTGQFAQYLKPKATNARRILAQRSRSVPKEFRAALDCLSPIGSPDWRSRNRWYRSDALSLLAEVASFDRRPRVVYADPPYSAAQHSRYYHVLDVITEYRYPAVTGTGRYPDARYQTPFANSGQVLKSLSELAARTSTLGACLVLSYPANGLFVTRGGDILELLRRHFRSADLAYSDRHSHSAFGGPKASNRVPVLENVYVARP